MQLAPFQRRIFRHVWIASLASNLGGLIQTVGASWLMTSLDPSAGMVSLVQAANTVPVMLFSLMAGALADNLDRRKLMLAAQVFLLASSVLLAVFSLMGLLTPAALLGFTFLIGCGTAINGPAWQSLVGEMVPRAEIPAAIALNSVGFNIARSVGPAIGGFIVAWAGAFWAFAINAVSYLGLIVVLARWRLPQVERRLPPETLGRAMAAGVRYVAMSPRILNVMARSFVFGAAAISVQALMPLIARDLIQGGPLTFGLLLGAFGVGAIAGAFLGGEMRRRSLSAESCVALAFAGAAACAGGAALSGRPLVTMGCMLVGGASWVLALAGFNAAVQLSSPRWVVGRAVALYQMAAFGGMAVGSWAWGIAAEQAGTRNALLGSAVVLALGAALGRVFPVPDVQELDLTPREWKDPEISLDIRPQSGPIIVAIEYRIRPEDEQAFMSVMAGRRRIRLRDGARHWTLMRDLADPTTWIERYDCPTWQEYLRQNQRMTQADTDISKALIALHQGPAPIVVRRMIERQTSFPEHAMSREAAQAGS